MRKLISLFGFFFLVNIFSYGQQALIDIPLTIVNENYSQVLTLGGDQTATNGIDAVLDENILPPPPAPGTFDVRFDLKPYGTNAGTLKDYRYYSETSITDTIQHTLIWQLATGTTFLAIHYGLPSGATMNIKDGFGGLTFNSGTLTGTGRYIIPAPSYNHAIVTMTYINIPINQPLFSMTPSSLNLGFVIQGNSSAKQIKISNDGNRPLNISGVVSSDQQFTFGPNSFPAVIAAGSSQVFNVNFTPTDTGTHTETLTILHDAPGSPAELSLSGTGYTQGGLLRFSQERLNLLDWTENNQDTIVLENYTGQPMKELKFELVIGKSNGKLILRSVERGTAIPSPQFNFSYEIFPGVQFPDGSSIDTLKVRIKGNGTNSIHPLVGTQELLTFAYDVVNINKSDQTTNSIEKVLGLTQTPMINANIYRGSDEIIKIWVGNILPLLGDVNLDDQINLLDIFPIIDHIFGRTTLRGLAFTMGDMAPWSSGQPLPLPDGVINELDLTTLRYIVLTGRYPSFIPFYKVAVNAVDLSYNSSQKLAQGIDAKLTFHLKENRTTIQLESIKKVKGVQIEFEDSGLFVPGGTKMTSVFDHALYFPDIDFLRILAYDSDALAIEAGEYIIAELPIKLNNPEAIRIFIADENNHRLENIEVEIRHEEDSTIPRYFALEQNYPNPFNTTTKIKYSIPNVETRHASSLQTILKVYDILGNEIVTLVNETKPSGNYEVVFNAEDLSSGVYFYRLTSGEFTSTKKMLMIK